MMMKKLLAWCAVFALVPAIAVAGGGKAEGILIEQVRLGGQAARLDVYVPTGAEIVQATATAVANSATSLVSHGDNSVSVRQDARADVTADTELAGGQVYGAVTVATTAYGNSADAATGAGNNHYRAEQSMSGDTAASTSMNIEGADTVNSTTVAAANVSLSGATSGDNLSFQIQEANGSVRASTDAIVCCIASEAGFETIATGNVAASSGRASTTYNGAAQSTGFDGSTIASASRVYSASASNVTGAATAAGNTFVMENEGGYATLGRQGSELYQGNGAAIVSSSDVELDHWSGMSASIAFGVGNIALATNTGADLGLNAIQSNFAGVEVSASLAGQSWTGGTGQVVAAAAGNVASANLCSTCVDGALYGNVTQFNQGSISAFTQVNTPVAGQVTASASAIGNAATFTSSGH